MNCSKNTLKNKPAIIIGIAVFIISAVLGILLGGTHFTLEEIIGGILRGPKSGGFGAIFYYVRLPRVTACLLSGAALAVSGVILQGVLANKLASPNIIGVNAGAGLGVTICCAFGVLSGWFISLSAFLGALAAAGIIAVAAHKTKASRSTVILGGVAVNSILNAMSLAVSTLHPESAAMSSEFRVGGFSAVSAARVLPAGVIILLAIALTLTLSSDLDVMTLGDDSAKGLGMNVKAAKVVFIVLAALLAGAAVSFSGLLGFVGLIVPHAVRRTVTNRSGLLCILSALFAGAFVCICDTLGRVVFAPFEMPVGIIMSVIGGPFFVFLLIKGRGGHNNA